MTRRLASTAFLSIMFLNPAWASTIRVGVSVLPLETLVRAIGGNCVEVSSLQQEGDSCSVFEPRPSTISWLANADLFFRTGIGFETSILVKLSRQYKDLEILDLRDSLESGALHHLDHHHGGEVMDPHIWMDPKYLARMGDFVAHALAKAQPDNKDLFFQRAKVFNSRMLNLDKELASMLAPFAGRSFFIYHPALGYFAESYDLHQVSIETSGHGASIAELQRLIEQARREKIGIIYVQPQESRRQAEVVAEAIHCRVETIDPMSPELEVNLRRIAKSLVEAFSGQ